MSDSSTRTVSPPLVAIVSWLVPGAGYWLLGQRARALTVGITITVLFVSGLLIGGVRLIEVPGFGDHGEKLIVSRHEFKNSDGSVSVEPDQVTEQRSIPTDAEPIGWVMRISPLEEIRNKPWYIAQILAGPLDLIASWGSIKASGPGPDSPFLGFRSHARNNELGVLYTAVAGMLNLLAIIDAASRAAHAGEQA